jgi:hypothetical protein
MANAKITDLTAASTPLAGTELFETVQASFSRKVAASEERLSRRICAS